MIQEITPTEFYRLKEGFCLVDVYGEHCGPCKVLGQTLESIAFDYPFIDIYKLSSDAHPAFCKEQRIMGVPVLFFVLDGVIKEQTVGALPGEQIMEIASKYLYDEESICFS